MIENSSNNNPTSFDEPVCVGKPNLVNRYEFIRMVNDILDRRWYTNDGQYVRTFENELQSYLGVKHCIAVCNATIGLEILFQVIGLTGNVILPSFTFIATAHALKRIGLEVKFCDIDLKTHNLDPNQLEKLIDDKTTAILGVHVWGRPCDVEMIDTIAARYGLKVLYDAAHAFGCSNRKIMIGNFGSAEVFSFHATKFFNTFEGGAITTNDDEIASKLRSFRNFGFLGVDHVGSLGTNAKMAEINAAMGLSLLSHIDELVNLNKKNYQLYESRLSSLDGMSVINYDPGEKNNFQYVVLELDEQLAGISRDSLIEFLNSYNVIARRYFYPGCHKVLPYLAIDYSLPNTEHLCGKTVLLPTGNSVSTNMVSEICDLIHYAFKTKARLL